MNLHSILRTIIDTDGQTILLEMRLINILDDLNAFDRIPASRYIFRSLILDGYTRKMISIGEWNSKMISLCHQFISNTGFNDVLVSNIFQCVAYGLHYIDKIDTSHNNSLPNYKPSKRYVPERSQLMYGYEEVNRLGNIFEQKYTDDCEKYIESIIEMKGDWNILGTKITPSCVYKIYGNTSQIEFFIEIDGEIKRKGRDAIRFHVVLYNDDNKILDKTYSYLEKKKYKLSYQVFEIGYFSEISFKYIGNISKVIIYWDIY